MSVTQEEVYELAVAVLRDVDKLAASYDELSAMIKDVRAEVSLMHREMKEQALLRRQYRPLA
jgi:hypothetical protein